MRLAFIIVPLAISLATAGGIMLYASAQPPLPKAKAPDIVAEVRHPVSEAMLLNALKMSKQTAPFYKVQDARGVDVQIGGTGSKPQFVYFILDGCPCSFDVQPLFNSLYTRYKGKVDFIGIINVGKAKALDYAGPTMLTHPIVCSEDLKIMKAFGAKQSTYSALILPDGTIAKMWPGYSQSSLHELNKMLAKLTDTKEQPFDAQYAPKEMTSGCYFY